MENYKNAQGWALAACLDSEYAVTRVIENLEERNFSEVLLRNIFTCINSLFAKNVQIDAVTLLDEMKEKNFDFDRGWMLTKFMDSAGYSDSGVDDHIKIIKKHTLNLDVKILNSKIMGKIGDGNNIHEVIDYARDGYMNIDKAEDNFISDVPEAVVSAMKEVEKNHVNKVQTGLQSNIYNLNKKVLFKKGNLIIIAAKKSVGKTALANQIAFFNASQGKKGAIFNLEMSKEDLVNREIARVSGIDLADITMGRMNSEQFKLYQNAAESIMNYNVKISTKRGLTLPQIHSRSTIFKNQLGGLDFIIIDYMQKIRTLRGHSRQSELATLSEEIGVLAQHFGCPIFALSQVNHEGITREAEDLENDADIVLKLRRPMFEFLSKYSKDSQKPKLDGGEMPENYSLLKITKNRNGKTGTIILRAVLENQKFEEWGEI